MRKPQKSKYYDIKYVIVIQTRRTVLSLSKRFSFDRLTSLEEKSNKGSFTAAASCQLRHDEKLTKVFSIHKSFEAAELHVDQINL